MSHLNPHLTHLTDQCARSRQAAHRHALLTGARARHAANGDRPRRPARLITVVLLVLVWTAMLSFGGVAAETVMLYPNIFGDAPASLHRARAFLTVTGPSDYFPPLGAAVAVTCLAATALTWREPLLRWLIVAAGTTFLTCEFLFSAVYFWPRNHIMFVDPIGTHSDPYLRQVAHEFIAGHWVRVIGGAVTAVLVFAALQRWTRATAQLTGDGALRSGDGAESDEGDQR